MRRKRKRISRGRAIVRKTRRGAEVGDQEERGQGKCQETTKGKEKMRKKKRKGIRVWKKKVE